MSQGIRSAVCFPAQKELSVHGPWKVAVRVAAHKVLKYAGSLSIGKLYSCVESVSLQKSKHTKCTRTYPGPVPYPSRTHLTLLTETWQHDQGNEPCTANMIPSDFCMKSFPRVGRRGGGIAVLYKIYLGSISSPQSANLHVI